MAAEPQLIPFRAEHLLAMVNRDGKQFTTVKLALEKELGVAYTAVVDDKMIGCAGVLIMWDGVGYAWACFTDVAPRYLFWGTKIIRRVLRDVIKAFNLHRVEMVALDESPVNKRWAEHLGFVREKNGVANAYTTDKRAMVRYEWING